MYLTQRYTSIGIYVPPSRASTDMVSFSERPNMPPPYGYYIDKTYNTHTNKFVNTTQMIHTNIRSTNKLLYGIHLSVAHTDFLPIAKQFGNMYNLEIA